MSGPGTIIFEQKPVVTTDKVPVITNWTPMIGYMLYQDDISDLYYFSLILEVYKGSSAVAANLLAKIKQKRNGYGPDNDGSTQRARAFFDLRDIVNSQLVDTIFDQNQTGVPFQTIHKLGANTGMTDKVYSDNGDNRTDETQIIQIHVKGYQQYSESTTEIPSEYTSPNVDDELFYMAASLPLMTARDDDAEYIQGTAFQTFQAFSVTDRFLSDVEISSGDYNLSGYINYVQWDDTNNVGDYHTVAFLNDTGNFSSDVHRITVVYKDADDVTLSTTIVENNSTNGGWIPSVTAGMGDKHRLLYYGCGPGNLDAQEVSGDGNAKPSDAGNDGWAYYYIQGYNYNSTVARTAKYYFIRQDSKSSSLTSCKGFKTRRLAWRNSLGCYDYFNFKKKSTQRIEVNRNNYSSIMGRFNGSKWYYNNTMRGNKTRQVTAVLKETLNTDWITEQDANLLEKLIMSTDVYIVENIDTTYTEPVMITDTSFVKKTVANDKLIQYTIQIEYANPINTNS
jgi:hypothetical protein